MKRHKDRLHRVIVIGATPAGISATNKLGELGIPVTLVDSDYDLDRKLSREDWKLKSGVPFNYAHRPGLLRILRNPVIQCAIPAEVNSIKHTNQGFRVELTRNPAYVKTDQCILCGRCVEVCPVTTPEGEKAVKILSRRSFPGRAFIDKRKKPPCQESCPLGVNVPGYIALAKSNRFSDALNLIRKENVLPGICGRICTHPCEDACRRSEVDEPLAIRSIKRFLADHEISDPKVSKQQDFQEKSEKIVVIGSGPAGLSAAADLARYGYQVSVLEKEDKAGGLLRYGIGPYRLPGKILDIDLEYISNLGVKFIITQSIDLADDLDRIRNEYNAVIISTGAGSDRMPNIPGEDLDGIEGCLSFMGKLSREEKVRPEGKIAVIGGGNSALDVARSLIRLGTIPVIVYRRRIQDMPADPEEIVAARKEGISIMDQTQVVSFLGKNGKINKLHCIRTKPGEPDSRGVPSPVMDIESKPFELEFDQVFLAIGQIGNFGKGAGKYSFSTNEQGFIETDESLRTNIPGVYAAGDIVSGPSSVVEAMASGRKAARTLYMDFSGKYNQFDGNLRPEDKEYPEIPSNLPYLSRPIMPEMRPETRSNNFSEVALGLGKAQVISESERCLQCGVCSECQLCIDVCGAISAVNHHESAETVHEYAGALIIAEPESLPPVKGEDVIRAYNLKSAKSDVYAMISRGFAAAAQAMILLKETSQRLKGHGVSFSYPSPELSPEIRLGIFICRCNESLGWLEDMNAYTDALKLKADVVHAEIISSACVPEGSSQILRTIREKGITRVVLASCVCCPLNFVCSACTDQKSRLKDALFTGTGVSRSMVETCNLRGEVLRIIRQNASLALNRFTGLIERSIKRAIKLKPLPSPARNYNFATAVIGSSDATLSSALTLARTGQEVFLLGTPTEPLIEPLDHPNIHSFKGSLVKGLSGTLGDFRLFIETDKTKQIIPVGAVILGEKSRKKIQYIHQEGLTSRLVEYSLQKKDSTGVPFFYPGSTSIAGLYLANPPGINVSKNKKGAAAAVLAAADMPRGPRQNRGFTVVINEILCRGCGRCINICPYQAITMQHNGIGGWCALVDEALCKGCGNCISVCPSNAADSPYRDRIYLEQMLEELLEGRNG